MRMRLLLLIITAITIVSCNDARKSEIYRLLEGIGVDDLGNREEKAKYVLLMSMALDKNYIDRTDFERVREHSFGYGCSTEDIVVLKK